MLIMAFIMIPTDYCHYYNFQLLRTNTNRSKTIRQWCGIVDDFGLSVILCGIGIVWYGTELF